MCRVYRAPCELVYCVSDKSTCIPICTMVKSGCTVNTGCTFVLWGCICASLGNSMVCKKWLCVSFIAQCELTTAEDPAVLPSDLWPNVGNIRWNTGSTNWQLLAYYILQNWGDTTSQTANSQNKVHSQWNLGICLHWDPRFRTPLWWAVGKSCPTTSGPGNR